MDKKPTLRTISAATGFALTTVSRALAGDPRIAQTTRDTVGRFAAEIGYVPDRAAQRLRTGRTNVISLVVSSHAEILEFRGSILAGMGQALVGTRYHITMTPYDRDADPLNPILHILRNRLADGVIFSGTTPDDPRVSLLAAEGFPFVSHGRTDLPQPHAWCDYDNDSFARMAVARLAARGRQRVVLLTPPPMNTYYRHMVSGFTTACAAAGIEPVIPTTVAQSSPPEDLYRFVTAALSQSNPYDAYLCPGEVAAMAVLAALQDGHVPVGRTVDVIAKQTSHVFDQYRPRIDSIYEDLRAAGETLGQLLLRRIAGDDVTDLQVLQAPTANFRTVLTDVPHLVSTATGTG
jgi:LacI family transcriptional regulator